jgi:hypothetical protein
MGSRGGSGLGGGGLYSPGTVSFGRGSTANMVTCMTLCALVVLLHSLLCLIRTAQGGGCSPHPALTSPTTLSCLSVSLFLTPAQVNPSHCSHPLALVGFGWRWRWHV